MDFYSPAHICYFLVFHSIPIRFATDCYALSWPYCYAYFFQELPSPALLYEAIHAFKAAVQQTAAEGVTTKYKVIGSKGKQFY